MSFVNSFRWLGGSEGFFLQGGGERGSHGFYGTGGGIEYIDDLKKLTANKQPMRGEGVMDTAKILRQPPLLRSHRRSLKLLDKKVISPSINCSVSMIKRGKKRGTHEIQAVFMEASIKLL